MNVVPKHKVFVSFHHKDNYYRQQFEELFSKNFEIFVDRSVQDGDIDSNIKTETIRQKIREQYISDSSVTIVLIGPDTWQRKHVDWEIGYSLTTSSKNTRSGLIGILLPNYTPLSSETGEYTKNGGYYTPHNIPPRLYDNIKSGYAKIYSCPISDDCLTDWIDEAFQRRKDNTHINNRKYYVNNRNGLYWQD